MSGCLAAPALLSRPARAEDTLKIAVGQRGAWDTSVCLFGTRLGFFKDNGLSLDLLYTDGGAETQQAVVTGGVDVGVGAGLLSILGAFVRSAPLRILSSNFRGASDLFWYARADSRIQSFRDAGGKTVAFSTTGSSTNLVAVKLLQQAGVVDAKTIPTGNPVSTLTQVLSGQIDIGWSVPPIVFPEIEAGRVRVVGGGQDVPEFRNQTVRCLICTPSLVEPPRRDAAARFLQAYERTIDWMYKDEQALEWFAEGAGATLAQARRAKSEFYPREVMRLGPPGNLELSMTQARGLRRISAPLTKEQQNQLVQVPWTPPA